MLDQYKSGDQQPSIAPDFSHYEIDIDIDFELNGGKGAWVVILRKSDPGQQPLRETEKN